jgi:hypothetical protein
MAMKKGAHVTLNERMLFRRGWRGVFVDLNQDHVLEEAIFYSDSTSQDNLDVTDQSHDIHVSHISCSGFS